MNTLTERLLAEGYTKDNHPENVKWSSWKDFEYTRDYLAKTVWETPCGLLMNGIHDYENCSHLGVTYCPENDNPRFGCPYYDEAPCCHRFPTELWGWNCAYHQTDKAYDYDKSVEKLWKAWDIMKSQAWREAIAGHGYCACMNWNRPSRSYKPKYWTEKCINAKCANEICAITKQPRNLEKVNIYYDILRHWHYKIGLFEFHDRKLEKGVRQFEKAVARTDAEIWLRQNEGSMEPKLNSSDRRNLYFSEAHGNTGFGEYEFYHFEATVQNARIERREHRDLAQDLADIAEGIEVVHTSDVKKRLAQEKRERRQKRQEAKARKKRRAEQNELYDLRESA